MGDLSKNISRSEVACKCGCGLDTIDSGVIQMWQAVCDYCAELMDVEKVILNVHSGVRCTTHNAAEGGGITSQHLYAKAIDGSIEGVEPSFIVQYFEENYPDSHGIGFYNSFVHGDSRNEKARW